LASETQMAQYPLEALPLPVAPESAVLLVIDEDGGGADLSAWAREAFPEATVVASTEVDADGVEAALADGAAGRVVLVSSPADKEDSALQAALARNGVDPQGLVVVDLLAVRGAAGADLPMSRSRALVRGGVARARAYQGAAAQNMKIEFVRRGAAVSRRDLFATPSHRYVATPAALPEPCSAGRGCDVCETACPFNAIEIHGRKVRVDKDECTRCGLCLTACPTEAMYLPGCTPVAIEAEIDAALADATKEDPRAVLFMCERGLRQLRTLPVAGAAVPPEWAPVEVPCLAAVRPAWVEHALAQGAERVLLSSCFESCAVGQSESAAGTADYCRELLGAIGADPDLVRYAQPEGREGLVELLAQSGPADRPEVGPAGAPGELAGAGGEHRAAGYLARNAGFAGTTTVLHPAARAGIVRIEHSACTGCLTCVDVCPPRALLSKAEDGRVAISFDAEGCTGCGLCEERCPEKEFGAIAVERGVVVGAEPVREVIFSDAEAMCEVCGKPIAPNAMLQKVEEVLRQDGGDFDGVLERVRHRCAQCRGLS
jgi:formate hydrogenlyase subunit 6/NADH:ubiquinone oxidoreductase subunit I/coenzyme F420-reducing hydrogenase delta subunit